MFQENKDTIELYNKIIEAKKKIKLEKNDINNKVKIYVDGKFLGEYTEEYLKNILK